MGSPDGRGGLLARKRRGLPAAAGREDLDRLYAACGMLAPVGPAPLELRGRRPPRPEAGRALNLRCFLPRLVAELRDALDSCAERQRQLEQSLRVSRRLLRVWYATPGPPG